MPVLPVVPGYKPSRNPLKEALSSRFLAAVREGDDKLTRTKSGCALFENEKWVQSLLTGK